MCLESCFECQEPCWPVNYLLPAVLPNSSGFSCHSNTLDNTTPIAGGDSYPVGISPESFSHGQKGICGLHDLQPVEGQKLEDVRGESSPASPQIVYEKPWYVVGD